MVDVSDANSKYEKALKYEIFVKGEYSFAKEKIKKAKCIFDVWWHIWFFSQRCRIFNSNAKIYYFEPVKEFYDKAIVNLWNDKNIIFNNCWIASKSGSWILLFNSEKTMQSSKYFSFLNPKWIEISVSFITLNDYLYQNNIKKIDLLKMDIEWMEFEILKSRWDFERKKINNLVVEIHLLNEKMQSEWTQLFLKIKNIFWSVKVIDSWYRKEIFLIRASKDSEW